VQLSINNRDKTIMQLRTDLFVYATESLPKWNPSHDDWDWIPTRKRLTTTYDIAQDVYRHLVMYEDLQAYEDAICHQRNIDTWLARVFNKAGDYWKQLMERALKTKQYYEYDGMLDYYRPSLWFLREDWMQKQGHDFIVERIPSLVFFANDDETRLIYPTWKAKSKERIKKYVDLIESGKINDYDIPDEIYEEVYSEMRQK
jgi:hypothetical protein